MPQRRRPNARRLPISGFAGSPLSQDGSPIETRRRRPARYAGFVRGTLRFAVPIWTVFGLVCAGTVYWHVRTHGHSVVAIFGYELIVWNGWALATPLVGWLGRVRPLAVRTVPLHVAAMAVLALLHLVWTSTACFIIRPFDGMGSQTFGGLLGADLINRLFLDGTVYFAVLGVCYAVDLRERERRTAQLEASLAQARLAVLEHQLQPHFLFNTLHAIGGLVRQDRKGEAIEMIAGLSDLLRYSLDQAGKHVVPLEQEVAIVERYLAIQRVRFADRLAIEVDVAPETRRALVPALLLQPLAENAVKHGIEAASEPGAITLRARREGDALVVAIANTGGNPTPREGIGIANTRERLTRLFGERFSFALGKEAGGVVATVRLPFEVAA